MAFQVGIFNIRGTVGSITFYKRHGKYFARRKTSINNQRIQSDPAFAQFRACSTIFAKASSMASFIYKKLNQKQKGLHVFGKLTGKITLLLREGRPAVSIITQLFRIYKIKNHPGQPDKHYQSSPLMPQNQLPNNPINSVPLHMSTEDIQKFLDKKGSTPENYIKIDFKKRDSIYGLFIQDKDYSELKSKNFWRIVTQTHFDEYNKSKNVNLAKIFNGSEFSRLTLYKDSF